MNEAWRDLDRAVGDLERAIVQSFREDGWSFALAIAVALPICLLGFQWFDGNGYRWSGLTGLLAAPITYLVLSIRDRLRP